MDVQTQQERASETRAPIFLGAVISTLILAYITVALRCFGRLYTRVHFGIDDWLILAATCMMTAFAVSGFIAVSMGGGRHMEYVTDHRGFVASMLASLTAYGIATVLIKSSVVWFYCRIFPNKRLVWVAWVVTIFTAMYSLALILTMCLNCIPLSKVWNRNEPGTCIRPAASELTNAIINIITDVAVLCIPIRFVMQLKMDLIQKIQVCGIFLTGSIVCVFGIVRAVKVTTTSMTDSSYNQFPCSIYSFMEMSVGIVAACLPTLGYIFNKTYTSRSAASSPPASSGKASQRLPLRDNKSWFSSQSSIDEKRGGRLSAVSSNDSTKPILGARVQQERVQV